MYCQIDVFNEELCESFYLEEVLTEEELNELRTLTDDGEVDGNVLYVINPGMIDEFILKVSKVHTLIRFAIYHEVVWPNLVAECLFVRNGMSYTDNPEWPDFDERLLRE